MIGKKIDLESPIFVFYICTKGLSKQRSYELLMQIKNNHTYDNITTWFLTTDEESRVECVYDKNSIVNKELIEYIKNYSNEEKN